jgi:hypothetical protein
MPPGSPKVRAPAVGNRRRAPFRWDVQSFAGLASPFSIGAPTSAPLGPRSVVVADLRIAEELGQDEPGVRAPLADPAIRHDLLVGRDALTLVQRTQLLDGQESARRLVDRLRPRDVPRARDVARALRLLLRKMRRRQQLASELLRRANVHHRMAGLAEHLVGDLSAKRADPLIDRRDAVAAGRRRSHRVGGDRSFLDEPLLAPAVHQPDRVVAVVAEIPERVRSEPVVRAAVEHDLGVVADPEAVHQSLEVGATDELPPDRVLEVVLPVDAPGPRDVPRFEGRRVFVDVEDPEPGVPEPTRDLLGVCEDWSYADRHVWCLPSSTFTSVVSPGR